MGLFDRRKWEKEDSSGSGKYGGVLAVWGSPGCGKTTVSIKLAEYLSKKGNNVLVIFSDMTTPPIPYISAPADLIGEKSLGSILAGAHVTEALVKNHCILLKNNKYMSIIGMLKGENRFTYPPYEDKQAKELIQAAREIAPFVIIDCSSHIATNKLAANALLEADFVLRLVNCDLKSISYFSSQLALLQDEMWRKDEHIKVASNVKQNEAAGSIDQVIGKVKYRIPFSQEVEAQFLEGELLKELSYKESRPFRKEIEKISKEVYGI